MECAGINRKVFEEKDKIKLNCGLTNCKSKIISKSISKKSVSEEKIINLEQILSESLNCLSNKYDELLAINSKLNEENKILKASSSMQQWKKEDFKFLFDSVKDLIDFWNR